MKKTTVMLAFILTIGVNFSRAGETESLKDSSPDISGITLSDLQKGSVNGVHAVIPLPGQPGSGPAYFPPAPYPDPGYRQLTFNSGQFTFADEARKSMDNAVAALQKAGYIVSEKYGNFNSYTLVFQAPGYARIEQYKGGGYTFPSDAQKAANEYASSFTSQGAIVLEVNVNQTSFTLSYLLTGPYPNPGCRQLTFNSGQFAFANDARKSMDNAVAALQKAGYIINEKHDNFNSYTLSFLALGYAKIDQYKSSKFASPSDAQKAANEYADSFTSQGAVVLEVNVNWTSFTISYLTTGWHYPGK